MSIHLSPRLLAVASLVPRGARVIDVGTDHAMVPVWLAQEGIASHIWASDLREGPLRSASSLVRRTGTGERIELRVADGLRGFGPEDGDTIIIAGMGGETMISILAEASWLKGGALLILEPQSKQAELRRWLTEKGYAVSREKLVEDGGRLYPILTAEPGEGPEYTLGELYTGLYSQIGEDPLFGRYLDSLIRRASAAAPHEPAAAELLAELRTMKERYEKNDDSR